MNDTEFAQWKEGARAALEKALRNAQSYTANRARRGTHTPTDDLMQENIALYTDLLGRLDELDALRSGKTHSGGTGMLLMYDTHDGKVKP